MKDPTLEENGLRSMMDELNSLAEENRDVLEDAMEALNEPAGIMTIREALASDSPLDNVRAEIKDNTDEQRLFVLVYAGILEINSAGVSILWDRFAFEQVDQLREYLREIGAHRTCDAIESVRGLIVNKLGESPDEDALFDFVCTEEFEAAARPFDLQYESLVEEMKQKLVVYARARVNELEL